MKAKIKLPRKRKKAFIKKNGRGNYVGMTIFGELLQEEGIRYAGRYYTYTNNPDGLHKKA